MALADGYVSEINSITAEIKRLNVHIKKLREQKKEAEFHLYEYMVRNEIDRYKNITIKSVTPKPKIKRKTLKEKKRDAVRLFHEIGVPDPENFWDQFQSTQKAIPQKNEEEENKDELFS
jgi:hypothetical protein